MRPPLSNKRTQKFEKLALLYATPPLSPLAHRQALDPPVATSSPGQPTVMDSNDRRQRQNNPSGYAGQQGLMQTSPQYPSASAAERFRQTHIPAQSPASAPSQSRNGNQGYNYQYGDGTQFVGSSIPAAGMQYQAEYNQDSQRSQQQYQQYGSNAMYNVPSQQQLTPQSPYESVQPYPPRQSAALEVLSTQFGVPQQYYEGGPTSAPSAMGTQNVASQYPSYTSQSPVAREPLASAYAPGMSDPTQGASQSAYGQPGYQQSSENLSNAYEQYQTELQRTYQCALDGRLNDAGGLLIHISEWLLGNAEALGLVRDEEAVHADRLRLWHEFNRCWLAVLQKQKEMAQDVIKTGQRPIPPQSLLEHDFMDNMGKELVRLCDIMEKHGLVDYEMGVWEEEIVNILTQCLDLSEQQGGASSSNVQSSSSARRR